MGSKSVSTEICNEIVLAKKKFFPFSFYLIVLKGGLTLEEISNWKLKLYFFKLCDNGNEAATLVTLKAAVIKTCVDDIRPLVENRKPALSILEQKIKALWRICQTGNCNIYLLLSC